MSSYEQLPGRLNLAFRAGDDFATLIDFSIPMTSYTTSAVLYSYVADTTVTNFTTTLVNAAEGQVNVSLTKTQTAAITPGTYGWRLSWVDASNQTRSALTGFVEVAR